MATVEIGLCHDAESSCSRIKMWRMPVVQSGLATTFHQLYHWLYELPAQSIGDNRLWTGGEPGH